jgi:allantoinase
MATTLVQGGTVVTGAGMHQADLLLRDGRVASWHLAGQDAAADAVIDATGLLVLPGAIDVHTHFEEPDPNLLEGFHTGSMAAAAGGVTTVVEMPQAHPTTTTAAQLAEKREIAERTSIVDMAFWGGVTLVNGQIEDDLRAMAGAGAVAFKSFMASSSPFFPAVDNARLLAAMRIAAETGLPYGLHAEDDSLLRDGIARMQAAGRTDALAHAESRPPLVETVAVAAALALAEETGAPVHICHVASIGALRLIAAARQAGVNVTCETCPQYLVLDTTDLERLKGFGRCAPAIRERAEVEGIWDYLLDGDIDLVCSDHCGFTVESKQRGEEDIFSVPLGLQGVQTLLPSVWSEGVSARGMDPSLAVRLLSERPAEIFGLAPRKGSLAPGSDADLVLFDPGRRWNVTVEDHFQRQPWSPYEGMAMTGRVVRTIRRGESIFDDSRAGRDRILAAPGSGETLARNSVA